MRRAIQILPGSKFAPSVHVARRAERAPCRRLSRTRALKPIRTALAALPLLTLDLVERALRDEGGLEIVGHYPTCEALSVALKHCEVDVVIVGARGDEAVALQGALLTARPRLRVLLLDPRGGVGELYELRPRHVHLGAVSPRELARVVRDDAGHRDAWAAVAGDGRGEA